jgi:hypothetical protein
MKQLAFGTGIAIIVGTHVFMLNEPMRRPHALLNLTAVALILYSVKRTSRTDTSDRE